MNVQAVMSRNVKSCGSNASLADAARMMARNDCGALPVVDVQHKVIGMITDRDICLAVANADRLASAMPVSEVMAKSVSCCGPDDDLHAALQTMRNKKVRRLPVVDSDGKLRGLLSMDDIVLHAERGKGEKALEVGYGETVKTLKAIYQRSGSKKALLVQP
jgi:CBS domain-containing protein